MSLPKPTHLLPDLVWRRIAFFLSESLCELLKIASLDSDLRRICRPHISAFFHTIANVVSPLSKDYYYHDLVWLVLGGYVDPSRITSFHYVDQYRRKPPPTSWPGAMVTSASDLGIALAEIRRLGRLIKPAMQAMPFIPSDLRSEICDRFRQGDQDAALLILLPLLTRLKTLEPPIRAELCAAFFQSVAQEYRRRGINASQARRDAFAAAITDREAKVAPSRHTNSVLPFSELLILHVRPHQHGYSFPLKDILPFLGIPSLQRIVLAGLRDQKFDWPAGEVHPTCPEIYFSESSVSQEAALSFAQGLTAPCDIKQWYERPRPDVADSGPNDPRWDHIVITSKADDNSNLEISLDYDGGNPGYEHAWVSWLCREKMLQWERIDEAFKLEEGDEDLEPLQGLFA